MGHSFPQLPKTTSLVSSSEDSSKISAVDQLVPLDPLSIVQKAGDARLPTGILSGYRAGCLPVMIPDLDQPNEETRKLLFARADSLSDVIHILKQQNGHQ